jgi:steroid delta-isomerase-like uncharacterized protein
MSVEANKTLVRRTFDEVMSRGNLAVVEEVVSADFLNHAAPPAAPRGPAGMRGMATMLRTAFPDLHMEVGELIGEGDKVVAQTVMTGTHRGNYFGIPATGRRFAQQQMHIIRFADGKAVEHWAVRDDLGLLQQLGVIPDRGPGEAKG